MSESIQTTRPGWLARNYHRIAVVSSAVALIGVIIEIGSGLGYRFGILPLQRALLTLLPTGAYIAAAGAALCAVTLLLALVLYKGAFLGRSAMVIVGLIVGGLGAFTPYSLRYSSSPHPPIHDISTDIENPPAFVDVLPLREQTHATNTAEYLQETKRGAIIINIPEAQLKAYPDVKPIVLEGVSTTDAFSRALEAVKKQKWTLVTAKPEEGRIEAWDKTFWFGFIDDVVIRVTATDGGSKIDVRSLSRVGGGDVGKNAERIRGYTQTLLATKG